MIVDVWTRSASSFDAGKYTVGWSTGEQFVINRESGRLRGYQNGDQARLHSKDGMATLTGRIKPTTVARDAVQVVHGSDEGRDDPSLCIAQHLSPFLESPSQSSSTKSVFHSPLLVLLLSNSYPSELQRVHASRVDIDVRGDRKTESLGWSSRLTKVGDSLEHMIKSCQFQTQIKLSFSHNRARRPFNEKQTLNLDYSILSPTLTAL